MGVAAAVGVAGRVGVGVAFFVRAGVGDAVCSAPSFLPPLPGVFSAGSTDAVEPDEPLSLLPSPPHPVSARESAAATQVATAGIRRTEKS
ncbi:hypothetical protein SMD44_06852 [Streptomyces alboflavus]|uniref:Uncharacterized protein n=1 Tax=Streptomyces alboflavus TaxID=67267 RepID=A0A1Z1WLQ7_9ACTN|nr:hypothetical protein SMD44_06852 [Streptomyces alboflavus]